MANTIKSRILLKTDTTANWEKATNFIPKEGEVCIYLDRFQLDDGTYVPGIKVGDGTSYISELEFMGDEYISNEDIDEILGSSGSGDSGLTNETVTVSFPQIPSVTGGTTITYVFALDENNRPLYSYFSTGVLSNYSMSIEVIKNSCFHIPDTNFINDTLSYSGSNLVLLRDNINATGATYQVLGDVTFSYEEGAPV